MFLKSNIENSLEISNLPKIFKRELKDIENEIQKRKEFVLVCEEKRRKE
jgi:hypothetical protein